MSDRSRLHDFLSSTFLAHVGVVIGPEEAPFAMVLPMVFGLDLDGPDEGGTLYLHGSVAAGWLPAAVRRGMTVTVTEVDGLVLARSAFHHSVNYRSAVIVGPCRRVDRQDERDRALASIVDQMVPGRWATLRASTRKELAATAVVAVPLSEASMKERSGGPADEPSDVLAGTWAGQVPLGRVLGTPITAPDAREPVPADVARLVG